MQSVSALFDEHADAAERIDVVQRMTDDYFAMFGQYPAPAQLSRLGTYILRESDGGRARPAHGHMSKWQLQRRERREIPLDPARATRCTERRLYGRRKLRKLSGRDTTS